MLVTAGRVARRHGPTGAVVAGVNLAVVAALLLGLAPFLLLAAVALPAGVAVLRRPQRGLLLLAALLPFDGLLLIAPLPGLAQGWKEALAALTLVAAVLARDEPGAPVRPRRPPWTTAAGAYLALGVLLALGGGVTFGDATALKITYYYLIVAIAAWLRPLTATDRDRLVSILLGTAAVTAVVGLGQQVVGPEALVDLGYAYNENIRFAGDFMRSISTFNQPFPFAFHMAFAVLVVLPHALAEPRRLRSQLFWLLLPLLLLGLASSVVRNGLLGLGAGVAYLGIARHRALLALVPVALVGLLFLPASVTDAAFSTDSFGDRTTSWSGTIGEVSAHPFGNGLGTVGAAAERIAQQATGELEVDYFQPDNQYFKVAYELGVLGLWVFVVLVAGVVLAARSRALALRRSGRAADEAFALGSTAALLGAAVSMVSAIYLEIFPMDAFFWLFAAVAWTVPTGDEDVEAADGPSRPAPQLARP